MNNKSSSPVAKHKGPFISDLKQSRKDSGLLGESMLESSVHKTKVVRKIAREGKGGKESQKLK